MFIITLTPKGGTGSAQMAAFFTFKPEL
jgi:hypothetical protein